MMKQKKLVSIRLAKEASNRTRDKFLRIIFEQYKSNLTPVN